MGKIIIIIQIRFKKNIRLTYIGATLGATTGATTGAGKLFTNLLIISFGVRGVTKKPPQASRDWITQALRKKPTQAFALLNCSRSQS